MWFGGRHGTGDIILLTGELGLLTTITIITVIIITGMTGTTLIITALTIIATTIGIVTTIVRNAHIQGLLQGI